LENDVDVRVFSRIRIALSVESPERKWIARVQAGVLIVNQIDRQGPACIPDHLDLTEKRIAHDFLGTVD